MQPTVRNIVLKPLAFFFWLVCAVLLALIWKEDSLQAEDSHYFKAFKYALSLGLFAWVWDYVSTLLPKRWQQAMVHYWVALVLMWLAGVYVLQVVRYPFRPPRFADPLGAFLWHSYWVAIGSWVVVTLYVLWQMVRTDRRKLSLPQLWGLRFGLLLFAGTGIMAITTAQHRGLFVPYTFGNAGYPFYCWQTYDAWVRGIYTAGSHALAYLTGLGWLLSRKRLYQPYVDVVSTKHVVMEQRVITETVRTSQENRPDGTGPTRVAVFIATIGLLLMGLMALAWVALATDLPIFSQA